MNIQASIPLFTDVHGPRLKEGTSKYEDLLKVYILYETCARVNIGPVGQHFQREK